MKYTNKIIITTFPVTKMDILFMFDAFESNLNHVLFMMLRFPKELQTYKSLVLFTVLRQRITLFSVTCKDSDPSASRTSQV